MIIGFSMLTGICILVIGIIYKVFPPARINSIYGCRIPSAMRNQDTWDEGNRYSANLMIIIGIISIFMVPILYLVFGEKGIMPGALISAFLLIGMIILVELHLRKLFDKEGRRREILK